MMKVADLLATQNLSEGTWSLPDNIHKVKQVMDLLKDPVDPKDKKKFQQIYNLLGSDDLLDDIGKATDEGSTDVRPIIIKHLPDFLDTRRWFTKPDELTQFAVNQLKKKYGIR